MSSYSDKRRIGLSISLLFPIYNSLLLFAYFWTIDFPADEEDDWKDQIKKNCYHCIEENCYLGWKDFKDALFLNSLLISALILMYCKRKPYTLNQEGVVSSFKFGICFTRMIILLTNIGLCLIPEIYIKVYKVSDWKMTLGTRLFTVCSTPIMTLIITPKFYKYFNLILPGDLIIL